MLHARSSELRLHAPALVEKGAQTFSDYKDLIQQLGENPVVWLMIPDKYVPEEVDKILQEMPNGGIIVDGGNSNFKSTVELGNKCVEAGVMLVDVGTSGGVWGIKQGFSMMVGGESQAVERISAILDKLAEPKGAWFHFGKVGAGHFVKMVHNGIEYGIMQAFAEGYRILKEGPYHNLDLAKVAEVWQHGSINESFLNGLIQNMLKNDPEFTDVEGKVHESGEARWTLETATELGIETPVIQSAFDVRLRSQEGDINYATKFLAQLRNEFGGHAVNPNPPRKDS